MGAGKGTPSGTVRQGALRLDAHHLVQARQKGPNERDRRLRMSHLQDERAERNSLHDWTLDQLCPLPQVAIR